MRVASVAVFLVVAGCAGAPRSDPLPPDPEASPSAGVALVPFATGLSSPVQAVPAGGGRVLVVEQSGLVRSLRGGVEEPPLLDLRGEVQHRGEMGLLSAFVDAARARLFVSYVDRAQDTVVAWYELSDDDPPLVDLGSRREVLRVAQPYSNHNGGLALLGPDGMLWIGLGDGGSAGDPHGHGQNRASLLGKLLRLDVGRKDPGYSIPADNPFATGGGAPEVWALGLRNPWRFSFDRGTGDLWIGDVGQNRVEEVDVVRAGSPGGTNFGWNVFEGDERFSDAEPSGVLTAPFATYRHADTGGCSVTGGYVYRGSAIAPLVGRYLFADYCTGVVWSMDTTTGSFEELLRSGVRISSFGEDEDGEVFVVDHGGSILRLAPT